MITYIDMDGVLADFYQGAHDWMGLKVKGFPYKTGWNWPNEIDCSYRNFDQMFWANLPICKDAEKWLTMASVGDVIITTAPCGIKSMIGKRVWASKYFPELDIIFVKNKYLLAKEGRYLIDDSRKQIDNFNKYGGTGILVPRPWNEVI